MEDNIIWTCTYCHINPTKQSSKKCPRCGRKLTLWDLSKTPLERQPEWPNNTEANKENSQEESRIEYSKYFNKVH